MLLSRLKLCSLFIPHTTVPPEGQGGGDTSLPSSELLRADPRQHLLQAGHHAPASGHVLLICNGDTWGHGVLCTTLLYNLVPSEPQSHAKDTTPHLICGPQATHGGSFLCPRGWSCSYPPAVVACCTQPDTRLGSVPIPGPCVWSLSQSLSTCLDGLDRNLDFPNPIRLSVYPSGGPRILSDCH